VSNEMKTIDAVVRHLPDGSTRIEPYELKLWEQHARIAAQIVAGIGSATIVAGEENRPSPKAIASLACDIANQLMQQFEERGWLIDLPAPELATHERGSR
jgi:hypothetical protein